MDGVHTDEAKACSWHMIRVQSLSCPLVHWYASPCCHDSLTSEQVKLTTIPAKECRCAGRSQGSEASQQSVLPSTLCGPQGKMQYLPHVPWESAVVRSVQQDLIWDGINGLVGLKGFTLPHVLFHSHLVIYIIAHHDDQLGDSTRIPQFIIMLWQERVMARKGCCAGTTIFDTSGVGSKSVSNLKEF